MGFMDKLKNRMQMAKGRGKQETGRQTGDPHLEGEGRADRMKGGGKQVGEQAKDAFREVKRAMGRRH